MPTTVDNRVVRMEFDNREFERNVRTSMHTIDELKRKLDFSGAADSFNDLERSARRVQFDELSDNIEKLTKRFDTWGIVAKTTIENITNKAVDSAERIVKALSIDQATAGLQKYEDKMTQLSSLMNSISDKDFLTGELDKNGKAIVDYGKKLEYVEEQLAKIYWYSDETSMDSNAMITGANTYLTAGQTMEEAIETLMGLSNWTMASGRSVADANSIITQLGQSLGKGYVGREDFAAVISRGMAGENTKQQFLDAAEALGKLVKIEQEDGTYKYYINEQIDEMTGQLRKYKNGIELTTGAMFDFENATEVNYQNFVDTLTTQRWLTNDVLFAFAKNQGNFASELSKIIQSSGAEMLAKSWMDYVEAYTNTAADDNEARKEIAEKAAEEAGIRSEEMQEYLERLSAPEFAYGLKMLRDSQKTKTWTEALEATKTAAATAWSKIFEDIFGNSEESVELFSGIVEDLYTFFVEPLNELRSAFDKWKIDGYALLWGDEGAYKSFLSIMENVFGEDGIIRTAFGNIFGEINSDSIAQLLLNLTQKLKNFLDSLVFSEDATERLTKILEGFFALLDIGRMLFDGVKIALQPVVDLAKELADLMFGLSSDGAGWLVTLRDSIKEGKTFEVVGAKIAAVFSSIINFFKDLIKAIKNKNVMEFFGEKFKAFGDFMLRVFDKIKEIWPVIQTIFGAVGLAFKTAYEWVAKFFRKTEEGESKIGKFFSKIGEFFKSVWAFLKEIGVFDALKKIVSVIADHFKTIIERDNGTFLMALLTFVVEALRLIDSILRTIVKIAISLVRTIQRIVDTIEKKFSSGKTETRLGVIFDFLKRIGKEMIDWILPSINELKDTLSEIHWEDILGYLKSFAKMLLPAGAIAGTIWVVITSLQSFENIIWAFGNTFAPYMGINAALSSLSEIFDTFNKKLKVGIVKGIAKAALMFAGALFVIVMSIKLLAETISEEGENVLYATLIVGAIVGMLTTMTMAMALMARSMQEAKSTGAFKSMAASFAVMAVSTIAIAAALAMIAQYDWEEILAAGAALSAVVLLMAGMLTIVGSAEAKPGSMLAAAAAFTIMSASLLLIAAALMAISLINWDNAWLGAVILGAFVVVMAGLTIAFASLKHWGLIGAAVMLIIAVAAQVFASAMMTTALAIAAFAAAVVGALASFSLINTEGLTANFVAVTTALSDFTKALAEGLANLVKKSWLGRLLGIDKFFLILAVAVVAAAAGVWIFSKAMENLEGPIIAITKAMPESYLKQFGRTFALIALAAAGASLLAGIFGPLALVGAVSIAIAVLSIATGLKMVVDSMVKLSEIGPKGISNITASMKAFGKGVGVLILEVVRGIKEAVPEIFEILRLFFTELKLFIPKWALETFENFLDFLDQHLPNILEKLKSVSTTFITWMNDNLESGEDFTGSIIEMVLKLVDNINARRAEILDKLMETLVKWINSLADLIEAKSPDIVAAIDNLVGSLITLAETAFKTLAGKLGITFGDETAGGWRKYWEEKGGIVQLVKDAKNAIKTALFGEKGSILRAIDDMLSAVQEWVLKKISGQDVGGMGLLEYAKAAWNASLNGEELDVVPVNTHDSTSGVTHGGGANNSGRSLEERFGKTPNYIIGNSALDVANTLASSGTSFTNSGNTTNSTVTNNYSINVESDAADAEALAEEIARIIQVQSARSGAVWGR